MTEGNTVKENILVTWEAEVIQYSKVFVMLYICG